MSTIRIHFIEGFPSQKGYIDIKNHSVEEINKIMQVEDEEMVSFNATIDRFFCFTRKHISHWECVDGIEGKHKGEVDGEE